MKLRDEPGRPRGAFDPYSPWHLDVHYPVLARSFEASKHQFWDDTEVIEGLLARHGRPRVAPERARALAEVLAIIYYGEIVAMHVSAQLLTLVPDLDAQKVLAAQVVEEAKHVAAFARYVKELGQPMPPIDPFARRVLESLRATDQPALKLLGMQLLVENIAHALFVNLVETTEEPVLRGLLEFVDRDEVKHVGLARNYLPLLLRGVGVRKGLRMLWMQWYWSVNLLAAVYRNRKNADLLGIDMNRNLKKQFRELNKVIRTIGTGRRDRLAILAAPDSWNDWFIDRLFPARAA